MKKTKPPKLTRKQLLNRLHLSQARQVHNLHFASVQLSNAITDKLMGSEILLSLHYNDKDMKEVIPMVSITDGLSQATINAIREDLKRTYERHTELMP